MAGKHLKGCLISWVIRETQTSTTIRYHCTHTRLATIKKKKSQIIVTTDKEMGKLEPSYDIAGGNVKCCSHFGKQSVVSQTVKHRVTIWPSDSTLRYIPKKSENICPHRNLYVNVHSGIICNNQKIETIQMSIKRWMDIQYEVYPYNGKLFRNKKK